MNPTEKRGWGIAKPTSKPTKLMDRYCISPQLAPPPVDPATKKMFAKSEDYHKKG